MKTYLIHGPSGCGKDTQVDLILEAFPNFQKIGAGEMFRELLDSESPLKQEAIKAKEYWGAGIHVNSVLTFGMLEYWIRNRYDINKDWIFLSIVRVPEQILFFDLLLEIFNRRLDKFIHLKLSEEEAVNRLSSRRYCPKCQITYHLLYKKPKVANQCDFDGAKLEIRADDYPEKIKMRLKEMYSDPIGEIEAEYKKRDLILDIDASPSIEEIRVNLWKNLGLN